MGYLPISRPDEFAVVFADSDELHQVLHPKVSESQMLFSPTP
jgi:hypothetical protein